MSHDVERLAKVLEAVEALALCVERLNDHQTAGAALQAAERAITEAKGVTLPTPPRTPPQPAAAQELGRKDFPTTVGDYQRVAGAVIAAAVGALSDEAVRGLLKGWGDDRMFTEFRAALLARLAEGGSA